MSSRHFEESDLVQDYAAHRPSYSLSTYEIILDYLKLKVRVPKLLDSRTAVVKNFGKQLK